MALYLPAVLPEFSSSLQPQAEGVSWTAGKRGPFTSLAWIVLYHFTFINSGLVGVSHASVSLWGYSLSCGIPIELIIQISYIQFDCIQIGILQIMVYGVVTKTILELAEKSTVWESIIKIPFVDNQNSLLDISLAATRRPRWLDFERDSSKMTSKIVPSEKFSPNLTELRHRIALSLFQNSY